ncbi:MAG: hypothetical protein IR160_04250 [Salinibacterium sp.]|nr:hypothetical protein [Salinibacterium sp.]MBF0671779.1 hypothetical protein [Salinibacterium sp.]
MTDATQPTGFAPVYQMRTLAVCITDELRAQLDPTLTSLKDYAVTNEIYPSWLRAFVHLLGSEGSERNE